MTLSELRTLCSAWLDDVNNGYFLTSQLNTFLNNAQRQAQKELLQAGENFYVTRSTGGTTAGIDSYSLPSDFLKLHKLEIVLSGTGVNEVRRTLRPTTLVQIDNVSQVEGIPEEYTLKKDCFIMRPIPDNAYTLYLHYSYRVTDMALDNDTPDVPEQYHEYLAILATLDGFIKDGREAGLLLDKKNYYLKLMDSDKEERNVDAPRHVITTDDYGWDTFF